LSCTASNSSASSSQSVCAAWRPRALYRHLIERIGRRPTLIERDDKLPAFETLLAERTRAQQVLDEMRAWQ